MGNVTQSRFADGEWTAAHRSRWWSRCTHEVERLEEAEARRLASGSTRGPGQADNADEEDDDEGDQRRPQPPHDQKNGRGRLAGRLDLCARRCPAWPAHDDRRTAEPRRSAAGCAWTCRPVQGSIWSAAGGPKPGWPTGAWDGATMLAVRQWSFTPPRSRRTRLRRDGRDQQSGRDQAGNQVHRVGCGRRTSARWRSG